MHPAESVTVARIVWDYVARVRLPIGRHTPCQLSGESARLKSERRRFDSFTRHRSLSWVEYRVQAALQTLPCEVRVLGGPHWGGARIDVRLADT